MTVRDVVHVFRPVRVLALVAMAALAVSRPLVAQPQRLPPHLRPGRILGTVVQDGSDAPAVGATVSLRGTVLSATVLPDGSFVIPEVPAGVYELAVTGGLYETIVLEELILLPSDSIVVNLALKRHPLMGEQRVVTPSRRSQPRYEVASSMTVVDSGDAPFSAGTSIERVLAATPGVHRNGPQISIRGSSAGLLPYGSRVAVLLDGVPLMSPDFSAPLLNAVPLAALDRIEVLRGSGGVHYGSGAVAGVVNLVTPRPVERHQARAALYTGVYTDAGDAAPAWWGTRPLRFSGLDARWLGRSAGLGFLVAGGLRGDDGYRQYDERGGYELLGRATLWMERGAELRLAGLTASDSRGLDPYWRGADSALFSGRSGGRTETTSSFTSLVAEFRGVDSKSLAIQVRGYLQRASSEFPVGGDTIATSAGTRLAGEVQLTSYLNRRIALVYGAQASFDVASGDLIEPAPSVRRTVGGWAELEFTNLYDIVATFGTRVELISHQDSPEPHELHLTPSIGVAYHPVPSTSLRLTLGRGYRAPSLAERGITRTGFGVAVVPNPDLRSEQSWQGEISAGYRERWGAIKAAGELALFVDEYFSMIEPALVGTGDALRFVNATRARVLGMELTADVDWMDGLLGGSFSLVTLSARDLTRSAPLQGRAPTVATLSADWRPRPASVRLAWRYTARIPSVDAGTSLLVPDAGRRTASQAVDLTLGLDLTEVTRLPVTSYVAIRNLTGELATDGVGSVAPIRSVEVGLNVEF